METARTNTMKAFPGRSLLRWLAKPFTNRLDRRIDFRIDQRERRLRSEIQVAHAMIDWQLNALRDLHATLRDEQAACMTVLTELRSVPAAPNSRVDVLATWLDGVEQVLGRHHARADELQAWLVKVNETVNRLPPPEQAAQATTLIGRMERATSRMAGDRKEALALAHRLANIESALAIRSDEHETKTPPPAPRSLKTATRAVPAG